MSFVDRDAMSALAILKSKNYPFPRAARLRDVFSYCVTDYYAKASIGTIFEACGMMVTGESRVGKTAEVARMIKSFNEAAEPLPSGRPGRIVSCLLSKKDSFKELGRLTLGALGYPFEGRRTGPEIWDLVKDQARRQGVIGVVFDECQHVFSANENVNEGFRDSFKNLLKGHDWPLMLILTGVPSLGVRIMGEEAMKMDAGIQLAALLRPVHFDTIRLPHDKDELISIVHLYADAMHLNCDDVANRDFYERLSFACVERWGLVIELTIDAIVRCKGTAEVKLQRKHFAGAYALKTGLDFAFSPFTAPDYQNAFDRSRLLKMLLKEH